MISNLAFKTTSSATRIVARSRVSTGYRLKSTVDTPSPASHIGNAASQAVHPRDPRSLPRILVWVGAATIVASFAYKLKQHGVAATDDRQNIINEQVPPHSSAVAKIMADSLPIISGDREKYESIGKEGLGVDHRKTGKERSDISK